MTRSLIAAASVGLIFCQTHAAGAQEFRDEFLGPKLAPEFRVQNPDPDRWAMVEGEYVLLVSHEDVKNVITYVGELPESYRLTVRFATPPQYDGQGVGLKLGEADSTATIGLYIPNRCCGDWPYFYFNKKLKEEESSFKVPIESEKLQPFYMSLTKRGVEYGARFSFDEVVWIDIGTHISIRPYVRPGIRAFTTNSKSPESGFKIDWFELVDLTGE